MRAAKGLLKAAFGLDAVLQPWQEGRQRNRLSIRVSGVVRRIAALDRNPRASY